MSAGGVWLYKRLKSDVREIKNLAGDSFRGKTIEASFLGGVANFKISDSRADQNINQVASGHTRQLTGPDSDNINTLAELARLYERNLISKDEYERAKKKIPGNASSG
jgi:hypothetical protein